MTPHPPKGTATEGDGVTGQAVVNSRRNNGRFLLVIVGPSGLKGKDRVFLWRRANSIGATSIIRSVLAFVDDADGRERAEEFVKLIEERDGRAFFFTARPETEEQRRRIEDLMEQNKEAEVREFLEECDEFTADITKELKEEEFQFYELDELGDDLRKLEKWKTTLLERYPSEADLYDRLESRLEDCRKLLKTFERKCLQKAKGKHHPQKA